MSRYAILSRRSQEALGRAGALTFLLPLVFVASGCTPEEADPVSSLGAIVEAGRIEMAGSGFAIIIPDDWTVEVADPEPDVFSVEPGTAWWALKASAPYGLMACSLAVGVTDLPPNRWGTVVPGAGTTPHWGPSRPWQLRVPAPDVPESSSLHDSWSRPQHHEDYLEHDVLYSLDCAANEARVPGGGGIFGQLRSSFEFLPAEE
jgi:hypothetical protein